MISVGEVVELKIDSMNEDGQGVGRYDDFVIFVSDAIIGDVVEAKIDVLKKNHAFASCVKVVSESEFAIDNYNEIAHLGGGTSVLRMKYSEQLNQKQALVKHSLERIGKVAIGDVDTTGAADTFVKFYDIIGMDNPERYRNKDVYPCGVNSDGEVDFGYFVPKSHSVVFEHDSITSNSQNAKILDVIKVWANQYKISAYMKGKNEGVLKYIVLRNNYKGEYMVGVVVNADKIPFKHELINLLNAEFDNIVTIVVNINKGVSREILSDNNMVIFGDGIIKDKIGDLEFEISLDAFFQVNSKQTANLYDVVLNFADLNGSEIVWDIYCGTGTISLYLASKAKNVRGNELSRSAVKNAIANAKHNDVHNIMFESGKAEAVLPKWLKNAPSPDIIVLDPPRNGADVTVIDAVLSIEPEKIIYVSCKPSTMARDIRQILESGKYTLSAVQPVDMFAYTMNVESVVLLTRKHI